MGGAEHCVVPVGDIIDLRDIWSVGVSLGWNGPVEEELERGP